MTYEYTYSNLSHIYHTSTMIVVQEANTLTPNKTEITNIATQKVSHM